jgi:hypothetical protein
MKIKKIALYVTAFIGVGIAVVVIGSTIYFWQLLQEKSGYSHCVRVANESHFIGKRLKYSQAENAGVMKTEFCVKEDQEVDGGDGLESGRVRWVECSMGPDCDESGMF